MSSNLMKSSVHLRDFAIIDSELEIHLQWLKNVQDNGFIDSARADYTIIELQSYIESRVNNPNVKFWAIFLDTGKFIGTIKLEPIDLVSRNAWLGMMIGDSSERGKGYGSQALKQVLNYAEKVLKLKCLFLGVHKENYPALKIYENAGFRILKSTDSNFTMRKDFPSF